MNTRLVIPILVLGALAFACAPRTRTESLSASTPALMTVQTVIVPQTHEGPDIKLTSRFGVQVVPKTSMKGYFAERIAGALGGIPNSALPNANITYIIGGPVNHGPGYYTPAPSARAPPRSGH